MISLNLSIIGDRKNRSTIYTGSGVKGGGEGEEKGNLKRFVTRSKDSSIAFSSMVLFSREYGVYLGDRIQDTEYRIQDIGYRIQDTGYKIQDTGYRIQDTGYWIQDTVIQDTRCKT